MIRTAMLFGLWATLCMVLAITGFLVALSLPGTLSDLKETAPTIGLFIMFSPVAGIVAGLGWWLIHRKIARPAWWCYALLALGVVVLSHVLVFGGLSIGWWWPDLPGMAAALGFIFLAHGWLSVPVALVGTALFVTWNRRRAAKAS